MVERRVALAQLRELRRLSTPMRLAADGWDKEWQTLVAIIMSARTRDETTIVVGERLFKKYPSLKALAQADPSSLRETIRPVNFFRNKAKSILGCAQMLLARVNGIPPHSVPELINFPGVGRKTANVFLVQYGTGAIGVDTHVAYISRFLGWTTHVRPDKIEKDLERLFPKRSWRSINTSCVHFGKTHMSRKKKDALLREIKEKTT